MHRMIAFDPDRELMNRVRHDDSRAFAELVERYWSRVFGRFVRMLGDRQEAEDLAQEVFLRIYRNRRKYQPRARLSTWIYIITRNVGRNAIRRRQRRRTLPCSLLLESENPGLESRRISPADPDSIERAELSSQVRSAVSRLSRRQRRAVELRCANCSYGEIAAMLEMSPQAAKSLLYRARNELRTALSHYEDAV